MAKKPDANDSPSSKSKADAQLELQTFIRALPIATTCAWRDLIPIRKRINGQGWVKAGDVRLIREWAERNLHLARECEYLIRKFGP